MHSAPRDESRIYAPIRAGPFWILRFNLEQNDDLLSTVSLAKFEEFGGSADNGKYQVVCSQSLFHAGEDDYDTFRSRIGTIITSADLVSGSLINLNRILPNLFNHALVHCLETCTILRYGGKVVEFLRIGGEIVKFPLCRIISIHYRKGYEYRRKVYKAFRLSLTVSPAPEGWGLAFFGTKPQERRR